MSRIRDHPSWLILDRFVHRSDRDAEDVTTSITSYTCTERPIRASLRVADPPAVSRLYLHWPEFNGRLQEPLVIAAHEHSILFKAIVPSEDPMCCNDTCRFPIDFFVYSAFTSPPSLHRLPTCFIGGVSTPDEDIYFNPYRRRQQRTMVNEEVGLLCHIGRGSHGDFTVVDFIEFGLDGELCILHHHNNTEEADWVIKKVRFPKGSSAHYWITDAILPVRGRFLCWVDCYQGILVVDVLLANDKRTKDHQLRYIPLPKEALQSADRPYPDGDCPDPARSVCVTINGMLKLICITTGLTTPEEQGLTTPNRNCLGGLGFPWQAK